jgi:5,10-methylene-tetrahydrofolate dehydrogenase/methenyl tetrahydrofolate cyclohydrolase
MTKRIDGKARADRLVADVAAATAKLKSQAGIAPGLCAVLVREDPASQVYVRNKGKAAVVAGLRTYLGEETGRRVHAGAAERGSVEGIHAVLSYADIRGFTLMSDSLPAPSSSTFSTTHSRP